MTPALSVGRIPFLVCAPYFHNSLSGLPGVRFADGSPRLLNTLLSSNQIDCAPSSSFEYALHADKYRLLPGLCTSGRGEVKSVLLLSQMPWEELNGKSVSLSPDSETSNALFRVLCQFRFKVAPSLVGPAENASALVAIGDYALRESRSGRWLYRYDLAEVWQSWRGTPLPFGLWIVRSEAWETRRTELMEYSKHLRDSLDSFFADPVAALKTWNRHYPLPMPMNEALDFFQTTDYALTSQHEAALKDFYGLCREAGLLFGAPALRFVG
ncbi:MAG TPA: hypothetical protein DCQ83_09250 [Fibrobacteres bacterium]|nr:hypothetical protein [Fibrobacterota bacterium]